jgi:phage terminase large subunit-like protein
VSPSPFSLDHFESWTKRLILDNGLAAELEDFQREFVEDVFSGRKVCWMVVPQGNGKTTLLAALGLYGLRFGDSPSIPIAASSKDQARIMYRQMRGFVKRSDELKRPDEDGLWIAPFDGYKQIHLLGPGDTKRGEVLGLIEVHASDAGTADGVIPSPFAFLDELHRHKDELALHRTWTGKLDKRGAQLIVISTAGEPGSAFEVTREKIKAEAAEKHRDGAFGRYLSDRVVLHDYAVQNNAILDVDAVKAANPLSTITPERLEATLADPTMTAQHWRRFTCNLATMDAGREPYLDAEDWDGLADPDAAIDPGAEVSIGGDGSRTWDTTVIAWAHEDAAGVVTVDAKVFSVREDIPAHVLHHSGQIDFDDVEAFLLDRFDAFYVAGAAYDPRYLERSMDIVKVRLPEARVAPVEPASKAMRDALQTMFNLAAEGRLRHSGDPVLRAHVLNAGVERGYSSEIRRVTKIDKRLPIDAVPAMALAVWAASTGEPSVYGPAGRGLVVV